MKQLKADAKSVNHLKEVSYKLENKVIELTQNLASKVKENKEMTERIKNGEANGILTWEISRLSRNLQDTATLDKLLHHKQLLKIQSPGRDYVDKDGEDFMLNMEFVISRQYSKEVSRRTKRGLRYKLNEKHEWPGWSPVGYLNFNDKTQTIAGEMTPYKKQIQKLLFNRWRKKDYCVIK